MREKEPPLACAGAAAAVVVVVVVVVVVLWRDIGVYEELLDFSVIVLVLFEQVTDR